MVCGTLGTTVLSAIDPLDEIGKICKSYKIWFHIDGAFAGSFLMSDKLTAKIPGI